MSTHRRHVVGALVTGGIAIAIACSGGRSTSPGDIGPAPTGHGQLAISLVDAPSPVADEVWVNVTEVRAHSTTAGWVTVSPSTVSETTPLSFDLLKLRDRAMDLGMINLPPGTITQIRLLVTQTGNYVKTGGQQVDLKVPSGYQSGIKINGPWEITACNRTAVTIDFDAHKSAFWTHPTGQGDLWILRPVIHAARIDVVGVGCTDAGADAGTDAGSDDGGALACTPAAPTCAEGQRCVTGATGSFCEGGAGAACIVGPECVTSTCDATNRCSPGGIARSCFTNYDCLSSTCVIPQGAAVGTCAPGGANAPCVAPADCVSAACNAGSCTTPASAHGAGSPCTFATQGADCLSSTCTQGVCAQGGVGAPCNPAGNDCQLGLTCSAAQVCEPTPGTAG
jgi:hypothetical protein